MNMYLESSSRWCSLDVFEHGLYDRGKAPLVVVWCGTQVGFEAGASEARATSSPLPIGFIFPSCLEVIGSAARH